MHTPSRGTAASNVNHECAGSEKDLRDQEVTSLAEFLDPLEAAGGNISAARSVLVVQRDADWRLPRDRTLTTQAPSWGRARIKIACAA
jgi:hypothetical protein